MKGPKRGGSPRPQTAVALLERDKKMTMNWRAAYKFATGAGKLIQSTFQLLASLLFSAWCWAVSAAIITAFGRFCSYTWTVLRATMTVEVITVSEASPDFVPGLSPSNNMMELPLTLTATLQLTDEFISSGSNCNSSDGEQDSGLAISEAEEHDRLDDFSSCLPADLIVNPVDSDSSDDVSSDGQGSETDLTEKIIAQVESLFSDEHLSKDGFLLKHVRRRPDGFVSLKLIAGLRRVKQISKDFSTILTAVSKSTKLEVNEAGTKVRRHEPLSAYLKTMPTTPKEKENAKASGAFSDSAQDDSHNRGKPNAGTNGFKRNGVNGNNRGFSPNYQPNPLMYRNMMVNDVVPVSFNEENAQVVWRRRGATVSIPMMMVGQPYFGQNRNSMYAPPNACPPNATEMRPRPKSYCEGVSEQMEGSNGGKSQWLQRRQATTFKNSSGGNMVISGIIRQPRGPDGSKGFAEGYRQLIINERDETQATISA